MSRTFNVFHLPVEYERTKSRLWLGQIEPDNFGIDWHVGFGLKSDINNRKVLQPIRFHLSLSTTQPII